MAARVAARLKDENEDVLVETVPGELGEFSVLINDDQVLSTSRFWYPQPSKVVDKVQALLGTKP